MSLFIDGMKGLGDNVYQRPFVRAAAADADVYLATPWPQLWSDLPRVLPVRPVTTLRTQLRNVGLQDPSVWRSPPAGARVVRVAYGHHELARLTISRAIEMRLPLRTQPFVFDMPRFDVLSSDMPQRYVVVRPVTVRQEWRNEARNPLPHYLNAVAATLRRDGYKIVSVADLEDGREWLVGNAPDADVVFHRGELPFDSLMALVQRAAAVIGGVGWIVPVSIAARVPAFIVQGGHGAHNAPERITDARMDLSRIGWATPDPFCRCADMRHRCRKMISNLGRQLDEWRRRTGV